MPQSMSWSGSGNKSKLILDLFARDRGIASVLIALSCISTIGCSSNLAQVAGVVTLDGEPLQGEDLHATIYFQSASGSGTSGVGILDEHGNYTLTTGSQDGIEPGEYVVSFSASKIIPSKEQGGLPSGKRITDPKYASAKTSGLRFDVKAGKNQCDIPLVSPSK